MFTRCGTSILYPRCVASSRVDDAHLHRCIVGTVCAPSPRVFLPYLLLRVRMVLKVTVGTILVVLCRTGIIVDYTPSVDRTTVNIGIHSIQTCQHAIERPSLRDTSSLWMIALALTSCVSCQVDLLSREASKQTLQITAGSIRAGSIGSITKNGAWVEKVDRLGTASASYSMLTDKPLPFHRPGSVIVLPLYGSPMVM